MWTPLVTWWRTIPASLRDAVGLALLGVLFFAPALRDQGAVSGELSGRPLDLLGVVAALAMWLPFAVWRRHSIVCLTLVSAGFAVHELLGYPRTFATVSIYAALAAASAQVANVRLRRVVVLVGSGAYVAFVVGLNQRGSDQTSTDFALFFCVLAAFWLLGSWWRRRRKAERRRRKSEVEAAMRAERERIARDLHDVVTHHVTAMVVQADAAQYVVRSVPDLTLDLSPISETGRRALKDLRNLLDVLDSSEEIDDLIASARAAGQRIDYVEVDERDPDAPSGGPADLVSYRVVQESLTNALKYAPDAAITVRVERTDAAIEVTVSNEAGQGTSPGVGGSGRGLAGLAERVQVLGGRFEAGVRNGPFVVNSWIPGGDHGE